MRDVLLVSSMERLGVDAAITFSDGLSRSFAPVSRAAAIAASYSPAAKCRSAQSRSPSRAPVTVSGVRIGPGTTDGEFVLNDNPGTPFTLDPNDGFTVTVGYLAQVYGLNMSPLFVASSDLPEPLLVRRRSARRRASSSSSANGLTR